MKKKKKTYLPISKADSDSPLYYIIAMLVYILEKRPLQKHGKLP